jgi:hypothetical protein
MRAGGIAGSTFCSTACSGARPHLAVLLADRLHVAPAGDEPLLAWAVVLCGLRLLGADDLDLPRDAPLLAA